MRIGVLGGTFDPIHYGHLFIAEHARAVLALDRVVFVPNGSPPHKLPYAVSDSRHRVAMVRLAVDGNATFEVDDEEVRRDGPSYTVDTLSTLREANPGAEIVFLAGIDAVAEIGAWHEPDKVVRLCQVVAVSRPGFRFEQLEATVKPDLLERVADLSGPHIAISATEIRSRVRARLPIRYLTPDSVVDYILEAGLYRQ